MNDRQSAASNGVVDRRDFIRVAAGGMALAGLSPIIARAAPRPAELAQAITKLEPYFTAAGKFQDVSRGKPLPHSIPDAKKREVGLARDTWKLEVISDPDNPAKLGKPLTKTDGTALDFAALVKLVEKSAVRFAKLMTCLNIGCPLGMGLWEGVPLRDVIWMTKPREDLRRVFYYGYHNDDPKQMFRSSLPIDRVLEDPFDLPPVILCYKLNGEWLDSRRGGPVRIVVPEAYGFKSIKWLTHVVLTNLPHANDTYAEGNNDLESPLKSFAATIDPPHEIPSERPIPITGYAQIGISGVSKVQVWITPSATNWPKDDEHFTKAPWSDAEILPPPERWENLPENRIPPDTLGFDAAGRPRTWPLRFAKIYWAALLPGMPAGEYTLRCRTIDERGIAQPMPRPFRKSGNAMIEKVTIQVRG